MTLASDLTTRSMSMGTQVVSNMGRWYHDGAFFCDQQVVWPFNTFAPAALLATLVKFESPYSAAYIQMIREIMARVYDTAMGNGLAYNTPGFLAYGGYPQLPAPDTAVSPTSHAQLAMYDNNVMGPTRASMQGQLPTSRYGIDALNTVESCHPLAFMISQLPAGAITSAERAEWTKWCQAMCDYLDGPEGITYFYVNGNYQVRLLQAYWNTAMISKPGPVQNKYRDMYERALVFAVRPTLHSASWAGYGWVTNVPAGSGDWSDAKGYLTEQGGGGNGLDWGYTVVQAEALAGIYLLNRDERVLRMLNAISNQVEPRIDQTRWILDGTGGTRQGGSGYGQSFFYPILQALLGRKQSNTVMLTSAKILDLWDHSVGGDGGITNQLLLPTTAAGGFYSTSAMAAWYSTIAMTREAAYQATPRTPAA